MANPKLSHIVMDGTTMDINDVATAKKAAENTTAINGIKLRLDSLQTALSTVETAISTAETAISTAETDIVNIKSNMVVSVLDYGADRTGATDSAKAFADAIAATPVHGTCYIPHGEYRMESSIVITKPMTIEGEYFGLDTEVYNVDDGNTAAKPLLHAYTGSAPVVQIQSQGVSLRNIGIRTHTAGVGIKVIKGTGTSTVPRNILLDNVFIEGVKDDGSYLEIGFKAEELITSTFSFCRFVYVQNGFLIGENESATTSLHFDNCWVQAFTGVGYQLTGAHYSAFTACAADGAPWSKPSYGYAVVNCDSIAFTGCGAEKSTYAGVMLVTSTAISVIGHMFIEIPYGVAYSGPCQCTMIGCAVADDNYLATVSGDYNIIGCTYTKYKDSGTDKTDANKNHIAT